MFVLTLVTAPSCLLTPAHLARIEGAVDKLGLRLSLSPPLWLSPHRAADLWLEDKPTPDQMRHLRAALNPDPIDLFISKRGAARRKKLFLADMDATIVTSETLDELASHMGLQEKIAAITTRAMNGDLDFHAALQERVALLAELPEQAMHTTLMHTQLSDGAETLVRTLAAHGVQCVLVSGGFTFFTGAIASLCGFHAHHGNTLEIMNGRLTGRVRPPILDKDAKRAFLSQYQDQLGLAVEETLAVGDGANDLPMLEAAGLGFGYRPKKLLVEKLDNLVQHADLTALLYAQGYTDSEFVHRQTH